MGRLFSTVKVGLYVNCSAGNQHHQEPNVPSQEAVRPALGPQITKAPPQRCGSQLAIGWSVTLSIIVLRTRVLPRWLGITGLLVSVLYLFNQGDILATALPGFPVFDLAGLIGSSGWGLWIAALGITLLLRPRRGRLAATEDVSPSRQPASS
jgi:Domain of unknown function (DUF4386)